MIYNFKINDLVTIRDRGNTYTSFQPMAQKMNLKNWVYGVLPLKNRLYKIVDIKQHVYSSSMLAGIEDFDTGDQYIIGLKGLNAYIENYDFFKEREFKV